MQVRLAVQHRPRLRDQLVLHQGERLEPGNGMASLQAQVVLQIQIYIVIPVLEQLLHHLLQLIHIVQISILMEGQMHA